jgi:hypothetical protein
MALEGESRNRLIKTVTASSKLIPPSPLTAAQKSGFFGSRFSFLLAHYDSTLNFF